MYQEITLVEMEGFLQKNKGWQKQEPVGQEVYFDFQKGTYTIRVHSSIPCSSSLEMHGVSREVGKDAIRVSIIREDPNGITKGVRKFPRVTRQQHWRKNLKRRIMEAFYLVDKIPLCPACRSPMAYRRATATKNTFYGCTRFPLCKQTLPVED